MKAVVGMTLVLGWVLTPTSVAAQGNSSHRWMRVLATQGETVDLDTTAIGRRDGLFVVWLRWDLDRHAPDWLAEYRVEQVEVDCRAQRERLLSARRVVPDDTTMSSDLPLDSMDVAWRTYSKGSLGAQSLRELCRRLTRA